MKIGVDIRLTLFVLILVAFNATRDAKLVDARKEPATPDATQTAQDCGANKQIRRLALSPDGQYLLATWNIGQARIWNFKTGQVFHTFSVSPDHLVQDVAFSPDGTYVLISSDDGLATLWDVQSGEQVRTFGKVRTNFVSPQAQFSPDGKYILASYTDGAVQWEPQTGKVLHNFPGYIDKKYRDEISADSKLILNNTSPVTLWDAQTGQQLHSFDVWEATFSPDSNYISTVSPQGVQVWDTHSYMLIATLDQEDFVGVISPDNKYILTYPSQDTAILWNVQTARPQHTFKFKTDLIREAFSPDKHYLLIFEDNVSQTRVHRWDLETNQEVKSFEVDETLREIATSAPLLMIPDGASLITGSIPADLFILQQWDLQTGQSLRRFC